MVLKKILPILFTAMLVISMSACGDKNEHDHDYIETVYAPTCKEVGFTQRLCKICGEDTRFDYTPVGEHYGKEWTLTKEPTCSAPGVEELKCLTCNIYYEARSVEKLGHIAGEWKITEAPTCTEQGVKKQFCNVCGIDLETEVIEKNNHTPGDWLVVKEPNCKEAGMKEKQCNKCAKVMEKQAISITSEHEFSSVITPPTEGELGYTTYTCGVCGFEKKGNYVSFNGDLDEKTVYELVKNSVVRIEVYTKAGKRFALGSGFFIGDKGEIVTNYHVIEGAYSAKVLCYSSNKVYDVKSIIAHNKSQDVAIIQIDIQGNPYLELSDSEVSVGDKVYTLGSPLGVDGVFSSGIVSKTDVALSGKHCIAFTAPISSGNSGGPLLNSKGQVVGVNTSTAVDGQNFNFAVKAEQIKALDVSSPASPSAHYTATVKKNAVAIFVSHFVTNGVYNEITSEYVISDIVDEREGNVGLETYYVYNSDTGVISISTSIIQKNKRTYRIEMLITSIADNYNVKLYDYGCGQYTFEGEAKASHKLTSYENDYDKLFKVSTFRYNDEDKPGAEAMKQVVYTLYFGVLQGMEQLLKNSGTGLLLSYFNFNF